MEIGRYSNRRTPARELFRSVLHPTIGTIPMRVLETQGKGKNRRDCMKQFKTAWERFADDEANLIEFLNMKRKRR